MNTIYSKAVQDNLDHMGTPATKWTAVPVSGFEETEGEGGSQQSMPIFDFPVGYTKGPSLYKSGGIDPTCEWCGTKIKKLYWIKNDSRQWILHVGSECITHFGEEMANSTTMTGAEFNAFYEDKNIWTETSYWDDYIFIVDSEKYSSEGTKDLDFRIIRNDSTVTIEYGEIRIWNKASHDFDTHDLVSFTHAWLNNFRKQSRKEPALKKYFFNANGHNAPAYGCNRPGDNSGQFYRVSDVTPLLDVLKRITDAYNEDETDHAAMKEAKELLDSVEIEYGCHCDLEPGQAPDDCVIDTGGHCVYKKKITKKEECSYWRPI